MPGQEFFIYLGILVGLAINIFGLIILGFKIGRPFGEAVSAIKGIEGEFSKFLQKYEKDSEAVWKAIAENINDINDTKVDLAKVERRKDV